MVRPLIWLEEIVLIFGDDVDQVLLQRLLIGPRLRLAHRALGQLHIAAARPDERAHEGGRVVLDLGLHHVVHLLAAQRYRMRRAGIRSRRHGRDVGRFQDEESGGSRVGAAGSDVDDHRHRRVEDLWNDLARGVDQSAGRVQLDQHSVGIGLARVLDGAVNVLGADGLDGVVDA